MNVFRSRSTSYCNEVTIHFEFLEAHLLVQNLINYKVKVNVSPFKLTSLGSSSPKKIVVAIKTDLFSFLNVAGSQNVFSPDILFKTKLRYMGSGNPFTVEPSITLHFK